MAPNTNSFHCVQHQQAAAAAAGPARADTRYRSFHQYNSHPHGGLHPHPHPSFPSWHGCPMHGGGGGKPKTRASVAFPPSYNYNMYQSTSMLYAPPPPSAPQPSHGASPSNLAGFTFHKRHLAARQSGKASRSIALEEKYFLGFWAFA